MTKLKIQGAASSFVRALQNCKNQQSWWLSHLRITKCLKTFQTKTILIYYSSFYLPIFTSIQWPMIMDLKLSSAHSKWRLSSGRPSKTTASLLLPLLSCLLIPPPPLLPPIKRMALLQRSPLILISLFLSNISPFILLHFLHDYRAKAAQKKNSDKKIHGTELSHFIQYYFYMDSPPSAGGFFFFFFPRSKGEWRNNISNQILESFQSRNVRTTADVVACTFLSGIQVMATKSIYTGCTQYCNKKTLIFCFLGL